MLKLKRADYNGNYKGFTLKEGYYYGTDTETGNPIATSGWECGNCVAIYSLIEGKWQMSWWDIEETDFHDLCKKQLNKYQYSILQKRKVLFLCPKFIVG